MKQEPQGFAATITGTARTWRYTYTTYGRVLTATDPNNRVTTTSYHADNDPNLGKRGNVASITNAANHTTFITDYNPHGQPTRIVDPNGVVTVLTYDPRMRLTSRTVGNEATVFGYDPVGQMTSVNLPDGARLTYTYDAAHRLTAINDHKGNRIDYTLDAMGNRITEKTKDPGGVLVGNIARVIDALNQSAAGNWGRPMSRPRAAERAQFRSVKVHRDEGRLQLSYRDTGRHASVCCLWQDTVSKQTSHISTGLYAQTITVSRDPSAGGNRILLFHSEDNWNTAICNG